MSTKSRLDAARADLAKAEQTLAALAEQHGSAIRGDATAEQLGQLAAAIARENALVEAYRERTAVLARELAAEESDRRRHQYAVDIERLAVLLKPRETAALRIERAMRIVLKEVDAFDKATAVVHAEWPEGVPTISLAFRSHYCPTVSVRLRDAALAIDGFTEIVKRGHADLIADWRARGVAPDEEAEAA